MIFFYWLGNEYENLQKNCCKSIVLLLIDLIEKKGEMIFNYLLYKAEKPYVCLSVCSFWHAIISVLSASIEMRLASNDRSVFEDL